MQKRRLTPFIICSILVFCASIQAQVESSPLSSFLKEIKGASVQSVKSDHYKEFYVVMFPQPIDHKKPEKGTFQQRIFIGLQDYDAPNVMVTEGYSADHGNPSHESEPTLLLKANELMVEHRYFGKSLPAKMDYQFLTAEQAANDYHRIRETFSKIFQKGPWVATGVSKGGQTCTAYRIFFPDDVNVTIPYVAPLNFSIEDKRLVDFFKTVGDEHCRQKVRQYQQMMLENKKEYLPRYKDALTSMGIKFEPLEAEVVYDYQCLEFEFSYWQNGDVDCDSFPSDPKDAGTNLNFLYQQVNPSYYLKRGMDYFAPSFYMFYREYGYYEYDEKPYKKYLKQKDYPNSRFTPNGMKVKFDGAYIKKLKQFIANGPQNMIFVSGELDPWGSTAVDLPEGKGNSMDMIVKGGKHDSNLRKLDEAQRSQVAKSLSHWLGMEVIVPEY